VETARSRKNTGRNKLDKIDVIGISTVAARLFSLPCNGANCAESKVSWLHDSTAEAMRQDFESILNEPLPERFAALIRTLREEETRRAAEDKSGA
jgi:hypothetical protein